ncbi:aminoglycoside N(3)-acetyltransferase [Shimazuella kribbensis]|uniref:aminoglycoside N(3)-acetyltransferase n=1 Tax=Shimazuella kribbensis TaxID=139808 RepID=UPI0003FF5920|nr:AAC(3) family N-acetyltransferase [Shimazuella kribbensis]
MSELSTIQNTRKINTVDSLVLDFKRLGLEKGMNIIVHSSLSSIGYVSGGAVAVVQALMDVITSDGTIVMPTHTSDNSDPALWENPPVPKEWWPIIRETMPAFHPFYTPTRGMGKIVEVFRTFPGVVRSNHPTVSFAAWGKHIDFITKDHPIDNPMGEASPLARFYELNGSILLIGVGHDSNSSLHLAEYRQNKQVPIKESAAVEIQGKRAWVTFENIAYQTELFDKIGAEFEESNPFVVKKIGNAEVKFISQVKIVDFAVEWLNKHNTKT